jgi:hypothetical protein
MSNVHCAKKILVFLGVSVNREAIESERESSESYVWFYLHGFFYSPKFSYFLFISDFFFFLSTFVVCFSTVSLRVEREPGSGIAELL